MLRQRSHYTLTMDCVVFGYCKGHLNIALIKRKNAPFKGKWALPGGFLEKDETVEEGAYRELKEETGIDKVYLEQVHVFSDPKRDPRGRVMTVAFFALVDFEKYPLVAQEDAEEAVWWPLYDHPKLAFDHEVIVQKALEKLRSITDTKPVAQHLLPKYFRLSEYQTLYEQIFNSQMDKRNFRKKIMQMPFVKPTGKMTQGSSHRPAQLYTFIAK